MKNRFLFILIFALSSCGVNVDDEDFNYDFKESFYDLKNSDEMYSKLYNHKNKIELKIKFSNESLKKLQEYGNTRDERKDMYHPCDVTLKINNEEYFYEDVGARMRGNTSRTNSFVFDDNSLNKDYLINLKLSFNQTFDDPKDNDYYIKKYDSKEDKKVFKNRRLGSQKKIDLKWNKNFDYTFSKQSYAFYMYESEGIPAQKDNIVKTTIENETDSVTFLYDMLESIDEQFLNSHFDSSESLGNLYKCLWQGDGPADFSMNSLNSIGIETPSYTPTYDLKTNDDNPDHSLLRNFITKINCDLNKAELFKDTLDSLIDVDEFIKYSALSWVIGNPDDMRNNYNNFYSYFRSDNNKLVIIPYDCDRCFGILKDWEIHTEDYEYNSKTNIVSYNEENNPLFYRTIISSNGTSYHNYEVNQNTILKYEAYCKEFANKYLDVDKFKNFTNDFFYVNKDINNGGANNLSFKEYCDSKLSLIK